MARTANSSRNIADGRAGLLGRESSPAESGSPYFVDPYCRELFPNQWDRGPECYGCRTLDLYPDRIFLFGGDRRHGSTLRTSTGATPSRAGRVGGVCVLADVPRRPHLSPHL